jgi:hypothetical protein
MLSGFCIFAQNKVTMYAALEIAKYVLPSLVVFLTAWLIIKSFVLTQDKRYTAQLEHEQKQRLLEIKMSNQKSLLPVRLQAYERMALFLERISPGSLVLRLNQSGASILMLQSLLVQTIREEFDHNVAQQIYISAQTWELIKSSRDEMIKLVNSAAMTLPPDAKAIELSKKIIELSVELTPLPSDIALNALKKEVKELW